jgi:hypothetical protein
MLLALSVDLTRNFFSLIETLGLAIAVDVIITALMVL